MVPIPSCLPCPSDPPAPRNRVPPVAPIKEPLLRFLWASPLIGMTLVLRWPHPGHPQVGFALGQVL